MRTALRDLRNASGLTQAQLGNLLGYSVMQVSSWEREEAEMSFYDAYRVAEFFGCTLDALALRDFEDTKKESVSYFVMDMGLNDEGNRKLREYANLLRLDKANVEEENVEVA